MFSEKIFVMVKSILSSVGDTVASSVRQSLALLSPRDRRKYWLAVTLQMLLSLLDLVGVLLVGLVAAVSVSAIQGSGSQQPYVEAAVSTLGLAGVPPERLAVLLAVAAAIFLSLKSVLSVALIRRVLRFLAGRQATLSTRIAGRLLSSPITVVHQRSSQETAYLLLEGSLLATVILLGALSIAFSEVALLLLLGVVLFLVDPWITLAALVFFVAIAVLLQKTLGSLASRAGLELKGATVAATEMIQESVAGYRELLVSNTLSVFRDALGFTIWRAAGAQASIQAVAQVPKFVFETAIVLGALALAATQSLTSDPVAAVGTLALFLAAGFRVMPSLLRLQVALINMRSAGPRSQPLFELSNQLGTLPDAISEFNPAGYLRDVQQGHPGFEATVLASGVTYRYPNGEVPAIDSVSFKLSPGQSLALVGGTGAGKSTLADLILGVLEPEAGAVSIGGRSPRSALAQWPGCVGYVPQAVPLSHGSIRSNVTLGLPESAVIDELVWEALDRASLGDYLRSQRDGLATLVGERGVRLSGGQRQRLGIARALYSRPRLLVLDEATSALDAESEAAITSTLDRLAGTVTTITIAHRLATVRHCDVIMYLESGRVVARGSFDEVRQAVPAFDRQATLLGL